MFVVSVLSSAFSLRRSTSSFAAWPGLAADSTAFSSRATAFRNRTRARSTLDGFCKFGFINGFPSSQDAGNRRRIAPQHKPGP